MQTDGQLYNDSPPIMISPEPKKSINLPFSKDELLIIGLIILVTGDKKSIDLPLVLALIYILII